MAKFLIIPEYDKFGESLMLADEYNLGFEFNDFFEPDVLSKNPNYQKILNYYTGYELPDKLTMHGAFYDVTIFSEDDSIRDISERRVKKSVEIALEAGCEKVIFHTNINPFITSKSYKRNWLERNKIFFTKLCESNPGIQILMENMFDFSSEDLVLLMENMSLCRNFGICFDYAHACVYGENIEEWASELSPYIKHVHINDTCGKEDLHLPVGKGELDWTKFNDIRKNYFPDADILIETPGYDNQKASLDYMTSHGFFD